MKVQFIPFLVLALGLPVLMPATVGADEAADRKAEIERKKAAAKVRADERKKAGEADKKAAEERAAAEKKAADAKKAADDKKAEAEKKAADDKKKKDGDKLPAGGTGGSGGAAAAAAAGTGGTSGAAAGAGGKGATDTKKSAADEKDAPLPASDIDTLRKDRSDRRKSTVERLRRRWGRVLGEEKGASDLKLHARRVAFLQRVRVVAEGKKDKKTVEAVDELLTKEDDRHSKAMNTLREGSLTTGAGK